MTNLKLQLFGAFQAQIDDQFIQGFRSDKSRALLAYLASEANSAHRRETLADLLWGEYDERAARRSLTSALANLRTLLAPVSGTGDSSVLSTNWFEARFTADNSHIFVDVLDFHRLISSAASHAHRSQLYCDYCIDQLSTAVDLYGGRFLAGLTLSDAVQFDQWQSLQAERLEQQALTALETLASHHLLAGNLGHGERYARRQLALDPLRESAYRQLMQALAASGNRSGALEQYDICHQTLRRELGVDPEAETELLNQEIQQGQITVALPEPMVLENPYKGLKAFTAADRADFHGRERQTAFLKACVSQHPVTAMVGPSGSGKSSLLHAGLLAQLAQPTHIPQSIEVSRVENTPLIVEMRPGGRPFHVLAAGLAQTFSRVATNDWGALTQSDGDLATVLRRGDCSLRQLVEGALAGRPGRVLLVIDQCEELFTLSDDPSERNAFLDLLAADANSSQPFSQMSILLVLRADFTGQLLSHRPIADALEGSVAALGPMNREEMARAIEMPARAQGIGFQDGLVNRLLDDVGADAGRLPLLEFCLTQLWEQRSGLFLTHEAYQTIGGVSGALTRYADQVYQVLVPEEQPIARRVLTRMVRPGLDTEDTRRPVTRAELDPAEWAMVRRLADARLVVTDSDPQGQEIAEIVHESLITSWTRLAGWINADRAYFLWQDRVRQAEQQWLDTGRDSGALLRGTPLAEAEGWYLSRSDEVGPDIEAYVVASQRQRDADVEAVKAQQARELASAHALAEAEHQRFESEARSNRRLRWYAAALTVLALIALAAGVSAWSQRQEALTQGERASQQAALALEQSTFARQAESTAEAERVHAEEAARHALGRQLAAQAINVSDVQSDLAMLLSQEALKRSTPRERGEMLLSLPVNPLLATQLHGHEAAAFALVLSSDGQILASGSEDGAIFFWNLESGQVLGEELSVGTGAVRSLAFSPDDALLAAGDQNGNVHVWDVASRDLVVEFVAHTAPVTTLQFSRDGNALTTAGDDQIVRRFDPGSGAPLSEPLLAAASQLVAISPAGDLIVSKEEVTLTVQSAVDGTVVGAPLTGHQGLIHQVRFSPDGKTLATASFDGKTLLYDVQTGQILHTLAGHDGRVLSVAFFPDGQRIATGGTDGNVILWDTATGRQLALPPLNHGNWVRYLVVTPDGHKLISGGAGGGIKVWDMAGADQMSGHSDTVRALAFSPDGATIASGSYDTSVRLWDAATGAPVREPLQGHENSIIDVAFSPDGALLASGSARSEIVLWDVATGRARGAPLDQHASGVLDLTFSPDGKTLASASFDKTVILWDVVSGKPRMEPLAGHEGWVIATAFTPDGSMLASTGVDATVRFWDSANGEALDVIQTGHNGWVTSLAFSPDGKTLVTGSVDETIAVWEFDRGWTQRAMLSGHKAPVWYVAYDPADPSSLISVDGSGAVIRWDIDTGEPLAPPLLAAMETERAVLSPDGSQVAIGSFATSGEIVRWQINRDLWEERACQIANRNLTSAEWEHYLGTVPVAITCQV